MQICLFLTGIGTMPKDTLFSQWNFMNFLTKKNCRWGAEKNNHYLLVHTDINVMLYNKLCNTFITLVAAEIHTYLKQLFNSYGN